MISHSSEVIRYIRRIRNLEKRRYAYAYLYSKAGAPEVDDTTYNCSYMAKQGVRLHIDAMLQPPAPIVIPHTTFVGMRRNTMPALFETICQKLQEER